MRVDLAHKSALVDAQREQVRVRALRTLRLLRRAHIGERTGMNMTGRIRCCIEQDVGLCCWRDFECKSGLVLAHRHVVTLATG